ncbi:MAG: TRAP transporter substrate-binding protein DctP, partial [Clostridiales Family XIII bacterium]|nr:TRAP transporter substrate-binding protein DctP [Clostridiales Family XIII bacterium]
VPAGYEGQTWELSLDDQGNDQMPLGLSEKDICKAIELRTNGQVKITPYFNNSLLEQNNKWPGAVQGLADIVLYTIDMNAGAQPMHSVLNQPANLPYPSNANTVLAVREFIANHPEFDAETESQGVVTISYFFNPATTLHMAKGEVKAATDLKGKKLIGNASIKPYVEGLGAASIAMGPGEFYTSLEKGVADGLVTHWAIVRDFNLLDVFESHTILGSSTAGINATCITWIMNKGVWDTIPPEYQAVIKEEFDWAGYSTCQYNDAVREAVIADAEAMGQAVNILSEEESAPFFENATEASKVWIAAAEAEGVTDAQALYDDWMAVLDKYN